MSSSDEPVTLSSRRIMARPPPRPGSKHSASPAPVFVRSHSDIGNWGRPLPLPRPRAAPPGARTGDPRPSVLVVGVYLANRPNCMQHLVSMLESSATYRVVHRWVSLGAPSHDPALLRVTVTSHSSLIPKFPLVNQVLAAEDLASFEYLLLVDDDTRVPHGFLDRFLSVQSSLGFRLAQPARTADSFIDHEIVRQEPGTIARETRWVEVGPIVSIHRSIFEVIVPFDLRSPMGWGYENIWAYELSRRGLKMGIIDATAVEHKLRRPHEHYDGDAAWVDCRRLLEERASLPTEECQRVLARFPDPGSTVQSAPTRSLGNSPPHDPGSPVQVCFAEMVAEFNRRFQREPAVFEWSRELSLARSFPELKVFSPPSQGSSLPYLDCTIDIVAVIATTGERAAEAWRVTRGALFLVRSAGSDARQCEVRWRASTGSTPADRTELA
jgi:hypothetical protein